MLLYHDPGDENDNKDISRDAEMIPKDLAEKINERNKLRNEIEEEESEVEVKKDIKNDLYGTEVYGKSEVE